MITPAYSPTATERVLPRLALDFTTATLDPRVTVTRALNTATRVNSSGFIEVVNADLPRFDYTLNTGGACKGLLIEESRVNIIRNWSDYTVTANWTAASAGGGSVPTNTGNTTTAPDGVSNAQIWQFIAPVSGDRSYLSQTVSGLATGFWASSVYVKAGRPADVGKIIAIKETQGATYTLVTLTDQWQRPESINTSAATAHGMAIELRPLVLTSTGTVQVALWGAQTEAGAFVTSAIPNTTSGSVTRNADVVSMTGTNFSSWYNASEGAFVVRHTGGSVGSYAFSNNDGTSNSYQGVVLHNATTLRSVLITGGNYQFVANTVTSVASANKTSFSYKTNSVAAASNAGTVATNNSITLPTVNRMFIGSFGSFGFLNGCVSMLNYYPQRLINAENQAFSK